MKSAKKRKASKRAYESKEEYRKKKRALDKKRYYEDVELSRQKAVEKYHNNKERILSGRSKRLKRRRDASPEYKAICAMRHMVYRVLTFRGVRQEKTTKTEKILGYTRADLVHHIEMQFVGNMSWDNHGDVWEIDHITSIYTLVKNGISDPKVVNCLTNLKPIYKDENRQKSNKEIYLI